MVIVEELVVVVVVVQFVVALGAVPFLCRQHELLTCRPHHPHLGRPAVT
jgi:hypothetical protein